MAVDDVATPTPRTCINKENRRGVEAMVDRGQAPIAVEKKRRSNGDRSIKESSLISNLLPDWIGEGVTPSSQADLDELPGIAAPVAA